ncbi:hypothetical protein F8388_027141, partial [Cannabis sativa]
FLISAHTTKPIPPPPTVRIDPRPRNRGLESPWNTNFSAGAGDLKQASKKRKARGQNVLVDLEERRAKSSVPLPLEVDVVSSKIVGKESITFPRLIGREVRLHVPGWYHSWASVPQQHQDLVLSRVKRNVGYIETWKEAHINKKTKTFVNENARRDYERLKAAYEKRASIPNSGPVDEIAILREVLGERRGHNRGVGRKLKGQSSTHRTQPVPTQQMPMDPRVERELARLRRKIQHMSQKLAPEDRLPSDDEIVDMGATHPIGPSQTHMSVDGSSSSSQPMATQYQQSQQTPLPFMFPFMFGQPSQQPHVNFLGSSSSSQQMSPFTWPMTPMSQMQMIQMMMRMQQII